MLITAGALFAFWKMRRSSARGLMSWVVGITLVWSLLMTIWLPWLDFSKTYRDVFVSMPLPKHLKCIATIGLGEGERAMLRYFTGNFPIRREINQHADCDVLLVQGYLDTGVGSVDLKGWKHIWEGARPGDMNQKFWLYVAAP
jgi:4-amino-4-deoxy-L-arabinose transferase-like glycosyltransferase